MASIYEQLLQLPGWGKASVSWRLWTAPLLSHHEAKILDSSQRELCCPVRAETSASGSEPDSRETKLACFSLQCLLSLQLFPHKSPVFLSYVSSLFFPLPLSHMLWWKELKNSCTLWCKWYSYIYILFQILSPLQVFTEHWVHIVGPYQLSPLCFVVCICSSQPPSLSLPPTFPFRSH